MTKQQKFIIFLNYFGTGLFIPILSLFLLAHGCNLKSLAAIMGLYSFTVVVAEVPSGVFADMKGRKASYYLSCLFVISSFILMYISKNIILLGAGMVLFGLGRAFISGSLDSLIIENCIQRCGEESLSGSISSNLVYQSAGIAIGSLIGGALPNISGYLIHILLRILILAVTAVLCKVLIYEEPRVNQTSVSIKKQIKESTGLLKKKVSLFVVMLCMFGGGLLVFTVETYWQPEFKAVLATNQYYLLGIISACGYGATILGSLAAGWIKMDTQKIRWYYYAIFMICSSLALYILSISQGVTGFMLCYMSVLFMLGMLSIPEQTIINSLVTNETRASFLSISSLCTQAGGILISMVSSGLVSVIGVRSIWKLAAVLMILIAFAASVLLLCIHKKQERFSRF